MDTRNSSGITSVKIHYWKFKTKITNVISSSAMTRKKFTGILSMLNNRNLMAEIKLQEGPKSFTINKKQIFLCIKDKKSGDANYYDYNSLIFCNSSRNCTCIM